MKKYGILCLVCFLLCCGIVCETNRAWGIDITLSHPILIPESGSIRVNISPEHVEDITESRLLLPGMSVASENRSPFTVLCPDFTPLSVSPGETFTCPETGSAASSDVLLLAESDEEGENTEDGTFWPGWANTPTAPAKDPLHPVPVYEQAIAVLKQLIESRSDEGLQNILCHLYSKSNREAEASLCYLKEMELLANSEKTRREALVQYDYALHLWKNNQKVSSVQWAQEALKLYQQVETYHGEFQEPEQGFLTLARDSDNFETQAFARHHLALLYRFYALMGQKQADKALTLYEQLEYPEMHNQLQLLFKTKPSEQ